MNKKIVCVRQRGRRSERFANYSFTLSRIFFALHGYQTGAPLNSDSSVLPTWLSAAKHDLQKAKLPPASI